MHGHMKVKYQLEISKHLESPATGHRETIFLGLLPSWRKYWRGFQVLRCYFMFLTQPFWLKNKN